LNDTSKHGKKTCVYEEAFGCKQVSLSGTKQTFSFEITGYLSQVPSGVKCHAIKMWKKLEVLILFIPVYTKIYAGKECKPSWVQVLVKMVFLYIKLIAEDNCLKTD
jgi:hypothetical protein